MDVYRAEVTFFNSNRRDGLFSLILLFCAVLLVTVLFHFQKAATNNTLISCLCLYFKDCLCNVVKLINA